jgi:hypothetical protein
MTTFGQALNTDINGVKTSARYADPGDGTARWFHDFRAVDGALQTVGKTADPAVTNDSDVSSNATVLAVLKGILRRQNAVATATSLSASAVEPQTARTSALAASLVVKAAPGRLRSIVGYSTAAQFIQVHNAATLPADAVVPLMTIPIAANAAFTIDFGVTGLPCSTGIVVCNSSTGPTKTIGSADTFITAVYQ